ncbi:MAG: hypothetical protein JWO03_3279 [Bacteroidetes bacterium]|nr:hypothetical protein [Bacteroidota bacterium]
MKKTAFLLTIAIALFIMGCNEKSLINDITGNWHVSKYVVDGHDRTRWFDTTYTGFKWEFTSDKKYTKRWTTNQIGTVYTVDTVRHFDSTAMVDVIDSITSTSAIVPYIYNNYVRGDWVLTNGNKYLEARDSIKNSQFEIKDHAAKNLHLFEGNEDYYLSQ